MVHLLYKTLLGCIVDELGDKSLEMECVSTLIHVAYNDYVRLRGSYQERQSTLLDFANLGGMTIPAVVG